MNIINDVILGLTAFFGDIFSAIPYILALVIFVYIMKKVRDISTSFDDDSELFDKDNPAIGIATGGFYMGFIPVLAAVMLGDGYDFWLYNVIDFIVYCFMSIIFMCLARAIADKFILPSFSIDKELVEDQNQGTSWVMLGIYFATGWVIYGAIKGEPMNLLGGMGNALYYFSISQVMFVAGAKIYQKFTPYDFHALIEKDNIAAGMAFGGYLCALGTIIGHSGDLQVAVDDTVTFLLWSIVGAVSLAFFARSVIAEKILIPNHSMAEEIENNGNTNDGAKKNHGNTNAGWIAIASYQLVAWVFVLSMT